MSEHRSHRASEPQRSAAPISVELLYFDGCPHSRPLLARLRDLLDRARVGTKLEVRRVDCEAEALRLRFLGSPTLRVNGRDVEVGVEDRTDYGLRCRVYRTAEGTSGVPSDDSILAALRDPFHEQRS